MKKVCMLMVRLLSPSIENGTIRPFDAFSTDMRAATLCIADDHQIVLAGLLDLFSRYTEFQVIGSASCGRDVPQLVEEKSPDILILDIAMPGGSPIETLEALQAKCPITSIVIYSAMTESHFGPQVKRYGCRGYVDKASPVDELISAIRTVASGSTYFNESEADYEIGSCTSDLSTRFTHRQLQAFVRLARGERIGDIVRELGVTDVTISTHRAAVLAKLGFSTNAELTRYALENGYIT